jgi:hypothetical protein
MNEDQVVGSSSPLVAEKQEVKSAGYIGNVDLSNFEDTAVRQQPPAQEYDPEQQHDVVRTVITCSFIIIFCFDCIFISCHCCMGRIDLGKCKRSASIVIAC